MAIGGGAPSAGGGAGRRGGGTGGGADAGRQTWIAWHEAVLKTPGEITPHEGEEAVSEVDAFRDLLGMSEWDPKPVLLYFHRDHEDGSATGKPWAKQCGELDDERVARWSGLYHFVEIDADKSEPALLERFGAGEGPSFSVIDRDLNVKARSGAIASSKRFAAFLESSVKSSFAEYWKLIQERLDGQKELLSEAADLERKKDVEGALARVRQVTRSSLRVGSFYDDAVKEEERLSRKLTDE